MLFVLTGSKDSNYISLQEIISETTAKLEETEAQREETQRALDCTRTVLHKTEGERAEQVINYLITVIIVISM